MIKRFDYSVEKKLVKHLNGWFDIENQVEEDYLIKNDLSIVDRTNVSMIYGKSEEAKRFLSKFVDLEVKNTHEYPLDLDWKPQEDFTTEVSLSLELLKLFSNFLEVTSDKVKIKAKKDYPFQLETDDFEIVFAPRIDEDE